MTDSIDRQIHEMMGLKALRCCGNPHEYFEEGNVESMGYPIKTDEECCGNPEQVEIPKYSTDIAAAFEVVEWLESQKVGVDIRSGNEGWMLNGGYSVKYFDANENPVADGESLADTLPMAICQAALKATESK